MTNRYICPECSKVYKVKKYFDKHYCEPMRRKEEMQTNVGISAYELYSQWFKAKNRRIPKKDTFLTSKYYKAFIRFASFSKQMAIPDKIGYIKYMVKLNIEPTMWDNTDIYQKYIDNFDNLYTPLEQVDMTVDTMLQLSEIFDCTIKKALFELNLDEVNKLIQAKKLSPWVLLLSKSFMEYVNSKATPHEKILLDTLVNPKKWKQKFYQNKTLLNDIKKIVKEMNM